MAGAVLLLVCADAPAVLVCNCLLVRFGTRVFLSGIAAGAVAPVNVVDCAGIRNGAGAGMNGSLICVSFIV